MHFNRIFFRKVGKAPNQCGHLCIPIGLQSGCERMAVVRQQWLICTAKESPKSYVKGLRAENL